jgi:predicted nicotinamide N-methyase
MNPEPPAPDLRDWPEDARRLAKRYRLQEVRLELGDRRLELLKVVNIDDLLDEVTDADQIPFWADLWPASIGLALHILSQGERLRGKKVLELGAGVGLAGIAARIAGAEVVQSDFSSEALRFTRVNCRRNGVPDHPALLADWREFPAEAGTFDLILGADILYEKTLHPHLARIFATALNPGGAVWLADPGRDYARQFGEAMAGTWRIATDQIPVEYEAKTYRIQLYRLTRGNN